PQDVTVAAGATATFTVGASGTPPLLYQWSVNSAPISGATCSSYAVLSASLCNSGALYSVTVSNLAGGHHQPAAGRDRRRWRNGNFHRRCFRHAAAPLSMVREQRSHIGRHLFILCCFIRLPVQQRRALLRHRQQSRRRPSPTSRRT